MAEKEFSNHKNKRKELPVERIILEHIEKLKKENFFLKIQIEELKEEVERLKVEVEWKNQQLNDRDIF